MTDNINGGLSVVDATAGSSLYFLRFSQPNRQILLPVRPMHTVYAQYKHISGTAAAPGQKTVSLSRIHLLNSLVDNLQRLKKNPPPINSSQKQSDELIGQYAAELHQAMKSIPQSFATLGGTADAGMVFSVSR